jgi:hypothetical protein
MGRHRRRAFLRGFGNPGFGDDLKDVAIGAGSAVGALILWAYTGEKFLPTPVSKIAVGGLVGVVGGTLLARVSRPAGIGVGATMGAGALAAAIQMAINAATGVPVEGLRAYPYSRRYGMHGVGQRDPYGYSPFRGLGQPKPSYYGFDIGRTRTVELPAPGMQLNQRDPYGYSPFHGLGRTRVTELSPPGFQLEAYPYSRRYGMHGLRAAWRYHSSATAV